MSAVATARVVRAARRTRRRDRRPRSARSTTARSAPLPIELPLASPGRDRRGRVQRGPGRRDARDDRRRRCQWPATSRRSRRRRWRPDLIDKVTPGRGGRPHRRLRPHPLRAADRAVGPRADPRAGRSPPRRRRRSPRPGRPRCSPIRSSRRPRSNAFEPGAPAVRLANALDPQASLLRRTLLPGLLETAHRNLVARADRSRAVRDRHGVPAPSPAWHTAPTSSRSAPSGRMTRRSRSSEREHPAAGLARRRAVPRRRAPPSSPDLAGGAGRPARCARRGPSARSRARRRHHGRAGRTRRCIPGAPPSFRVGDRVVGVAGEVLPSIAAEYDLPRVVAVVELDLDALVSSRRWIARPGRSGPCPAATQDVSLVVAAEVPAGDVLAAVVEGAGELLEDARLVDDYRGTGVAGGAQVDHPRAPLPRARPHPDRGRGDRREARRSRPCRRPLRSHPPRVAALLFQESVLRKWRMPPADALILVPSTPTPEKGERFGRRDGVR